MGWTKHRNVGSNELLDSSLNWIFKLTLIYFSLLQSADKDKKGEISLDDFMLLFRRLVHVPSVSIKNAAI